MENLAVTQQQMQYYLLNNFIQEQFSNGLKIYYDAYRIRLHNALSKNYPVLNKLLGQKIFKNLAEQYIKLYPSKHYSIRWFGDKFYKIISEPFFIEFAQFEWAMGLILDAADSEILNLDAISKLSPDNWINLQLKPHPAVYRLNLHWNIIEIWQKNAQTEIIRPEKLKTSQAWIIWRQNNHRQYCLLPPDEAWAIDAMIAGATLGEISQGLCQWFDEKQAAVQTAGFLKGWINAGLIIAFSS